MRLAIRWAIMGLNHQAHEFMRTVRHLPDAQVVAVAARTPGRASAFAEQYRIARAYDTYEALAENSDVDAVYVATQTGGHVLAVFQALRRKKATLCESPLALSSEHVRLMAQTARRNSVLFAEGAWMQFVPAMAEVDGWLTEKRIGEIHTVQVGVGAPATAQNAQDGALASQGIYGVQLSQRVMGIGPQRIQAMSVFRGERDVRTMLTLGYPGGAMASVSGELSEHAQHFASIVGERGSIQLPDFGRTSTAILHMSDSPSQTVEMPYAGTGRQFQLDLFMRALRAGRTECPGFTLQDSISAIRVLEEARSQVGIA